MEKFEFPRLGNLEIRRKIKILTDTNAFANGHVKPLKKIAYRTLN